MTTRESGGVYLLVVHQAPRKTRCNIGAAFLVATDARRRATIPCIYDPRESEEREITRELGVKGLFILRICVHGVSPINVSRALQE